MGKLKNESIKNVKKLADIKTANGLLLRICLKQFKLVYKKINRNDKKPKKPSSVKISKKSL